MPPSRPATAWVWNTASVSSTFISSADFLCRIIMVNHGTLPAKMPMITFAHVCTSPAHQKGRDVSNQTSQKKSLKHLR
jgi:hypothetical protein